MVAMSVLRTLEVQLEDTAALWASVKVVALVNGQPDGIVRLGRVAWRIKIEEVNIPPVGKAS